ncbi:MAG TPA: methyltransferase domain-containing protein [Stenotrophobium sp.]|jgi:SAM-dependent methyltransferase|nr:methyltransferase domain-containing protein [Stenotrophobium sp.]
MATFGKRRGGRPFSRQHLELWLNSPRGRRLLELEAAELRRVLPEVFGRHVLQVGSWGRDGQLLSACETLHSAVIGTVAGMGEQAVADPESLPVLARSVDAVVLAHTLEFARSPQSVLRESNRILSDRGQLFVLGFNPWGGWGLRQWLGLRYPQFPPGARFHAAGRICDWLELLDFEVQSVNRFGVGFPWAAPRSDGDPFSLGSLLQPWAEAYLLVARKRVIPVSLIGRAQRAQVRPLIGLPAAEARRSSASNFEETRI